LPGGQQRCKIRRLLRVAQNIIRDQRPWLGIFRPDLGDGANLAGVIQRSRAKVDGPASLTLRMGSRVAGRADPGEVPGSALEPSLGWKRLSRDNLQTIGRNHNRHAERTAGSFLTAMAMADIGRQERTRHNVADFAAVAAAGQGRMRSRLGHRRYPVDRISKTPAVRIRDKDKPAMTAARGSDDRGCAGGAQPPRQAASAGGSFASAE
jgi:hypothetical protein